MDPRRCRTRQAAGFSNHTSTQPKRQLLDGREVTGAERAQAEMARSERANDDDEAALGDEDGAASDDESLVGSAVESDDFEAELRANEDTARCKQELAAQLELERYEKVERDAVRVGVSAEVAAAVTAVEDGIAEAVQRAAAHTRQAVAEQVSSQTRWLSSELPGLLQAQPLVLLHCSVHLPEVQLCHLQVGLRFLLRTEQRCAGHQPDPRAGHRSSGHAIGGHCCQAFLRPVVRRRCGGGMCMACACARHAHVHLLPAIISGAA